MNMNVYMPTRLFTGKGCVRAHKEEFAKLGQKCLIITGKNSAKACGALDDVTQVLDEQGIDWVLFDKVGQNPELNICMEAAYEGIVQFVDFIVGIGGGSPLDAAKCAAVFAANKGMTMDELYSLEWPNKPMPVVTVGTTAGTGSEVTKVAVITTPEGAKKSFHHEDVYPAVSFGDPDYTKTLSDTFTKSTAIDALAHCMESYFSRLANEVSRTYAVKGIRILLEQFQQMIEAPEKVLDYSARESLYNASIYGGFAINITGTCAPHTMGYLLTEEYGVPHGTACAVFLKEFYLYNKKVMPELTQMFLDEIGCDETSYFEIIETILPDFPVTMSEEDIERVHDRWIGNGSMAKGWGNFEESADSVLKRLFVKKK